MKRLFFVFLITLSMFSVFLPPVFAQTPVTIDGLSVAFDVQPIIQNAPWFPSEP